MGGLLVVCGESMLTVRYLCEPRDLGLVCLPIDVKDAQGLGRQLGDPLAVRDHLRRAGTGRLPVPRPRLKRASRPRRDGHCGLLADRVQQPGDGGRRRPADCRAAGLLADVQILLDWGPGAKGPPCWYVAGYAVLCSILAVSILWMPAPSHSGRGNGRPRL